ncbi:hypothetical protein KCU75_g58, partial [Aureobasidium melanogenum]
MIKCMKKEECRWRKSKGWEHETVSGNEQCAKRTALSNSRWVDEEDEMGIWKIELPLRAETSRQCLMTNNAQNRAALSNNAYLWCHGAHITLLCDGEEGRGAAGKAV